MKGTVWMCSWVGEESGRYLYEYDLDGNYLRKVHLQPVPQWVQGVFYYDGSLFLTADDGTADDNEPDHLYRVDISSASSAPVILENECPDCRAHFEAVLRHLDAEKVPYQINHRLVRGLDYYTRTTWEVVSNEIGSQGSVAGGGRYDGLVEQLGGPAVPGIGFACGMERLALLLEGREMPEVRPDFYVAVLDDSCRDAAFALAQNLRREGFSGTMGYESRSMKATMRQAGKSGARFTLIMGTNELASGSVIIKNMESGEQHEVSCADAAASLNAEQ